MGCFSGSRVWSRSLALLIAAIGGCSDAAESDVATPDVNADAGSEPEQRCGLELQYWVLENEPLRAPLRCDTGLELAPSDVELSALPEGANFEHESLELRWTPRLDQAANVTVQVKFAWRERGTIRVGVADRFEDPDNVPVVDPLQYTDELGLPVFHLGVDPGIHDADYTPASVIYRGAAISGAGAKYRGTTSAAFPKRSFTLKFAKGARFVDEARGFPGARRVVLTTTFDDNSYLRQRLAFSLWNALDPAHIPIHHFNAVVYVDGRYQGVYEVTDHVNDDFLSDEGLYDDVNMYKARQKHANFRLTDAQGNMKRWMGAGYTKEEGSPEASVDGAYADLEALVTWVATASDDEFYANWTTRLSEDFVHWYMLVSLIAAVDNGNKNYFLVHDPRADAPDPLWRVIPWDFNASFGQTTATLRRGPTDYDLARLSGHNRLFERLFRDERLQATLFERYRTALSGVWSLEEMQRMLDTFAGEVGAAAERDELRWGEAFRSYFAGRPDFVSHREEIAYLRTWIAKRWEAIAAQLQ